MTFKMNFLLLLLSLIVVSGASAQQSTVVVPIDSPAFVFSPANWVGDAGRNGHIYRQSWNSGAYFRVIWTTKSAAPSGTLLFDTSQLGGFAQSPPEITYNVDGAWTSSVPIASQIPITGIAGAGNHTLTVFIQDSQQAGRWGRPGSGGLNAVRVMGLQLDASSTPVSSAPVNKWALEIGDSITEGINANNGQADNLADYSYFVGEGLQSIGYEYGISACGYSGWLRPGDDSHDVPAYYCITGSTDGHGGAYDDSNSRWNKIDISTTLLDRKGHISAYGGLHEEPSIITINYGTNDGLSNCNSSDTQASITQSLEALRDAAPAAKIFLIIPFGQYDEEIIRAGLKTYLSAHPKDAKVSVIDLGSAVARSLSSTGYTGGLHPNMRGHAFFATQILAAILSRN